MPRIDVVFFDVGGTLGAVDEHLNLQLFASTKELLAMCRGALGLRLGVISNLPPGMTTERLRAILDGAGILPAFEAALVVSNADAGASKPSAAIYQFAAHKAGTQP